MTPSNRVLEVKGGGKRGGKFVSKSEGRLLGKGGSGRVDHKRKRDKGLPSRRAPLYPEEQGYNEEPDIGEEDLAFVDAHRAFLGSLSTSDLRHSTRAEKKERRARAAANENSEAEYERAPRGGAGDDHLANECGGGGVAMEAIPVKTQDGLLKFIQPMPATLKPSEQEEEESPALHPKLSRKEQNRIYNNEAKKSKKANAQDQTQQISAATRVDRSTGKSDVDGEEDEQGDWHSAQHIQRREAHDSLQSLQAKEERRAELKVVMAKAATALLEAPEANHKQLKVLLPMCADKDEVVAQLAMVSLLAVFKDICPGYRIRLPTDKELEVKVSKEVQRVRDFEAALLKSYQHYLRTLLQVSSTRIAGTNQLSPQCRVAVKCMCGLLSAMPHFNYRTDLLSAIIPKAGDMNPELHVPCCEALVNLCREDIRGEASLEATQMIAQLLKEEKCKVPAKLLEVLLCLKFDRDLRTRLDAEDDKLDSRKQRSKDRKQKKGKAKVNAGEDEDAESALNADLKEGEARIDPNERRRIQTQILEAVFEAYFRILKYGQEEAIPLLEPTFLGLAKFAHLISVDFLGDLLLALHHKLVVGELGLTTQAMGILAACDILSGQGTALNIDPSNMMKLLYNMLQESLPHGETAESKSAGQTLVSAVQRLLCDRRNIDMPRLAAFVKRLGMAAMHSGVGECMGFLGCMRQLLARHISLRSLLDNEGSIPGVYKPEAADPEQAGAQSAMLWEMSLLARHWHPAVAAHATALAELPLEGLAPSMGLIKSGELFNAYNVARGAFNPPIKPPTKQRVPHGASWRRDRANAHMSAQFRILVEDAGCCPEEWREPGNAKDKPKSQLPQASLEQSRGCEIALDLPFRHMFRQARDFRTNMDLRREVQTLEEQVSKFRKHLASVKMEDEAELRDAELRRKAGANNPAVNTTMLSPPTGHLKRKTISRRL